MTIRTLVAYVHRISAMDISWHLNIEKETTSDRIWTLTD